MTIGLFSLFIIGDDKLVGLLPQYWKEYKGTSFSLDNKVVLSLAEGRLWCEERPENMPDGWFLQDSDGNPAACYVLHGQIIFELQYNSLFPGEITVCIKRPLDNYIRLGVQYGLMLALYRQCIGLHGVTVLCGNEIVILSAPSGTGKTTLGRLLEKYCDAVIINGDFALLSLTDHEVMFEPTPFCGTSRRCLNHRFRVNRIVFLEQAKTNQWQLLTGMQALIYFLNNCFVPSWDNVLETVVQDNVMRCISSLKVNAYSFAPTKEAAEEFYRQLNGSES